MTGTNINLPRFRNTIMTNQIHTLRNAFVAVSFAFLASVVLTAGAVAPAIA